MIPKVLKALTLAAAVSPLGHGLVQTASAQTPGPQVKRHNYELRNGPGYQKGAHRFGFVRALRATTPQVNKGKDAAARSSKTRPPGPRTIGSAPSHDTRGECVRQRAEQQSLSRRVAGL